MKRYTFVKLLDGSFNLTFSNNFSLWSVWDFENDVEIEFRIFFSEQSGDIFVEFANAFS